METLENVGFAVCVLLMLCVIIGYFAYFATHGF